jgi:hypothetical protein
LAHLAEARIPFLVGGAFALEYHTGIWRYTKDLDIFMRPRHIKPALEHLKRAGLRTELTFPHWLAKVYGRDDFVDVIFSSGNGVAMVDDDWFTHAKTGRALGASRRICPVEEMIWSKAFVMERERYDGADLAHLILAHGQSINWRRLLKRFGPHWAVLFSHLTLFGFIYPGMKSQVPNWVIRRLVLKFVAERKNPSASGPAFQGTLLSREQYLIDLEHWGYPDARLRPNGSMSAEDISIWTEAIEKKV